MWATPTKQETSDILGKMSFWYHCKEHTFCFDLEPKSSSYSHFFRWKEYELDLFDHLCKRPWVVSL